MKMHCNEKQNFLYILLGHFISFYCKKRFCQILIGKYSIFLQIISMQDKHTFYGSIIIGRLSYLEYKIPEWFERHLTE